MTYFNGSIHGFNSSKGYIAPIPVTKVYCDKCAWDAIPLKKGGKEGQEHWDTDFRWCGHYGGKCHVCKCDC